MLLVGIGFGPLPSLTAVTSQNVVARHQLGIAIGSMNFVRNLYATILIAVFGAIVLAGRTSGAPVTAGEASTAASAGAFGRVFVLAAVSFTVALVALLLMEEKPLRTDATPDAN